MQPDADQASTSPASTSPASASRASTPSLPRPPRLVLAILFLCGAAFCWGALGHHLAAAEITVSTWMIVVLAGAPLLAVGLGAWVLQSWEARTRPLAALLERHAERLERIDPRLLPVAIAVMAGLGLFAELAVIRIHSAEFQLFAYFKNLSLLSCFLGLGIGYARGDRGPWLLPLALPLLAFQLGLNALLKDWGGALFLQNPIPEQFSLGMMDVQTANDLVAVFGFIGFVFAVNAVAFIPFGQAAGRLMQQTEKLRSYGFNLLGSLLGIALFNLVSYLWAPPVVWMLLVVVLLVPFLMPSRGALALGTVAAMALAVLLAWRPGIDHYDVFSPYQKLTVRLERGAPPEIQVANVYYQRMLDLSTEKVRKSPALENAAAYYGLPHVFAPAAERVLIVGAGSGNDVAAALRHGARHIDAVEIDPAILELGRRFHPENPYASERVQATVDDARSFLSQAEGDYDLVVYALLDSHTLLSGVSSVRLDSFVYTVEGFQEARERLAPGGILAMTFSAPRLELARKIHLMLEEAFEGRKPRAFYSDYDFGVSFLIRKDGPLPPPTRAVPFRDISPDLANPALEADPSTDDWPFFYMPERRYPVSYLAMVAFLILVSTVFVRGLAASSGPGFFPGFSAPCFFLGAGFMLIETKAITELALVYGSTWVVIGAVIAAILTMAWLANAVVLAGKAPPRSWTYLLLLAAVGAGLFVMSLEWGGGFWLLVRLFLTAALTLPLFFSGLAFSEEITTTATVSGALASNMLGAMLGGFLEYNSMYFGFRFLYYLAAGMYVLAWVTSRRSAHHRDSSAPS